MVSRSNDEASNDNAGEESTGRNTQTTNELNRDMGGNEQYMKNGSVDGASTRTDVVGRQKAEGVGVLEAIHPATSVSGDDREVPTIGSHINDMKRLEHDGNGPGQRNKGPVLLDVESDDDHEEWPEIPLDYPREGTRDKQNDTQDTNDQCPSSSGEEGVVPRECGKDYEDDDPATTVDHGDLFLKHKVRQKDTLAGLAVKYNVSISDIKRANGYQTDTAMYGKEWVIIPRKPFPIGPEHAAWAGMILAHYEQGISLPLPHGTNIGNYYSGNTSPIRGRGNSEDNAILAPGHLLSSHQKEVEMMSRSATSSYKDDRLRRRKIDDDIPRRYTVDENDPATRQFFDAMRERDTTPLFSPATTARFNTWREKSVSTISNGAIRELKDLHTKSIKWRDQIFSKIKKAASQPAMAPASSLKKD